MDQKQTITKNEVSSFLKDKQKEPVIFVWNDRGNIMAFAGSFSLEELCLAKEVINRKIDSMLDQAIKVGVDIKPKMESKK